jgi:transposase InsO family protein
VLKRELVPFYGRCNTENQAFKEEYNKYRPHSSLNGLTPNDLFIERSKKDPDFSTLHWL